MDLMNFSKIHIEKTRDLEYIIHVVYAEHQKNCSTFHTESPLVLEGETSVEKVAAVTSGIVMMQLLHSNTIYALLENEKSFLFSKRFWDYVLKTHSFFNDSFSCIIERRELIEIFKKKKTNLR